MFRVPAVDSPTAAPTATAISRQTTTPTRVMKGHLPDIAHTERRQKNGRPPQEGADLPFQVPAQNEVNWEGNLIL